MMVIGCKYSSHKLISHWRIWDFVLPAFFGLHRMAGVRRDFWGSSSPTHLPKQGHLQ